MNKLFTYLLLITISLIFACSPSTKYTSKKSSITVDSTLTNHELAQNLINPYKEKLDTEMNEVLVISSEEFPKERGKAQTKLGNLAADLSLEIAQKIYADTIDFCLLNFGGLRTSLPKGEITRGKIFELMPFENELVILTMEGKTYNQLIKYLLNKPQPISGNFSLRATNSPNNNSILFNDSYYNVSKSFDKNGRIRILTSDYLANGGDNMAFFFNPIKYEKIGIKLRDAIIQYCKEQHQQGKQLKGIIDNRLIIQVN
ncbi:MAG: 5'-nucleotidase [Vicingaceae bacterium]|nr:5'-nucleotidase [Vicingaceae bacterium]